MRELLAEAVRLLESGQPLVWCAVVETRGSTPQKAGAVMLVHPDGSQTGTLGGGCVEAEVRQRALHLLSNSSSQPEIKTFTLDDDYGWDDGLICGGRMSMLIHPVEFKNVDYFRRYLVEMESGVIEAVPLTGDAGQRCLFCSNGSDPVTFTNDPPSAQISRGLPSLADRPKAQVASGVAYLPILPRIRLLIVGGGHVGQAVARLASEVEFDVWVLDDREKYANVERFPAAKMHLVGDIGLTLKDMVARDIIEPNWYCLIVTRGHNHDEEALFHLAPTRAGYVGMIGSKRKIRLIMDDLQQRGLSSEVLGKVHAPLGIPIGSQTVPEIAVSIVAELIACRNLRGAPCASSR